MPLGTLRSLEFDDAVALVEAGAAFIDLRPPHQFFDVHIPGSLSLLYEMGPGMASRARDCLPLGLELVILDLGYGDVVHAASSLRGKGYEILGVIPDALNAWGTKRGTPASCEVIDLGEIGGRTILHVSDPGAMPPSTALRIPAESLWARIGEVPQGPIAVVAGAGVRAALAVGLLERFGFDDVAVARSQPGS